MMSYHEMAGQFSALPGQATAAHIARERWGHAASESERQSLIAGLVTVRNELGHQTRTNRPEESVFWHNFRVADAVNQNNADQPQRALKTFIAVGHDLCEDTRKNLQPVQPEAYARLWQGTSGERDLIVDVLKLKTDAAGLEGDARRAAQLQRVTEARAGKHGEAGRIYVELMAADKGDNLASDVRDLAEQRLTFKNRHDGLEYVFKKIADDQIVAALPVDQSIRQTFRQTYEKFMQAVVLNGFLPQAGAAVAGNDERMSQHMRRALVTGHSTRPNPVEVRHLTNYAQGRAISMASDLEKLESGRAKFHSRDAGLEYAFIVAAQTLTVRAAPVSEEIKQVVNERHDRIMTHLLYAGSILPSLVAGVEDDSTKPPVVSSRPNRAARLSSLTRLR